MKFRVRSNRQTNIAFVTSLTYFHKPFVNSPIWVKRSNPTNAITSLCAKPPSSSSTPKPSRIQPIAEIQLDSNIDRQSFLRITSLAALSTLPLCNPALAETQFSIYKAPISLGFYYCFSYPSSWTVTKKAIKTHLSEVIVSSKDQPSTTAGLVVDAVKIDTIDTFGTPHSVGHKVTEVEMKKEGVKDATLQSASAVTKDGLTYYILDYIVDSTRGQKRYIAKATVAGNQLYVFTAQTKVELFQGETADVLATMLDSFNVAKQYS